MKITGPLIINIDDIKLSMEEAKLIENDLIGSIILFSHNFKDNKQIKNLIKEIKDIKNEIFISVDHEGGRVQRFKDGFTKLPSFETIGKQNSEKLSTYSGYISAYELRCIDIDINFSPVVDLNQYFLDNKQYLLKDRCFGSDPEIIIKLAKSYIDGCLQAGVIPVLKHFPGHGVTQDDSHTDTCISDLTLDDLLKKDLLPFIKLYKNIPIPIMTSHLKFPKIDNEIVTYSKVWLNKISQEIFSNENVFFISDDIEMKAAFNEETQTKKVMNALDAGCKMVIATTNMKKNIVSSKKSYEYYKKHYLTDELIDYCKEFCNDLYVMDDYIKQDLNEEYYNEALNFIKQNE